MNLDERHFNLGAPALTESSGTFLRRGWWYAKADILFLQRTWRGNDLVLASDVSPAGAFGSTRTLTLENSNPGREEGARLTLGRFLFRDAGNRDHTAEFTYFGAGEFGQDSVLVADAAGGISVVDGGATETFDGAATSTINYDSGFNSLEWNYVLTSRLNNDRAELLPNGEWVRRANSGWTYHGLFGLRYIDLTERVNWVASGITNAGIPVADADGSYDVRTENDAFGPQFGGGLTYESDRYNVTFGGKIGVLANNVRSDEVLSFTDGAGADIAGTGFVDGNRESTLAFLGQFSLTGRWHLRPHLSLRAGYEALLLTAIGLAPDQLNFNPADGRVTVSGDSFYQGISMGVEGYW